MDKKTAHELIEKTFNNAFSEEQFTVFAKNLLNDLEDKDNRYSGNLIWDDYKEHINTYKRIGKYIDPYGEALDVLIVEVKSVTKLERARTALRNFVIKHLSKFEKDYALVAFYSKEDNGNDWRFSFIKLEYRSELDEIKGKVKTKKEFTPAKRYSFLVGKYEKAHTAKNQLLPLLQNISNNPTIEELESAFSIEKVTDEFFNQYKDLYIKLSEHFENDSKVKAAIKEAGIDNARFTKKLLGQIVFLYFLQKKGWLGVAQNERWGTGKKRFVQELFEQAQNQKLNFFKDKLQYLFYEALAKERDNENSYYTRFDCRIPFLNGGLFEADYNWQEANISIPSTLFRNEEKNKAGDVGTGILDVFDRYNFTIKEDEPLDKEVAVDPEMLGKVFENMLDITERKSKGAFYTPREIVHYMCQESLIHYLDNALNSGTSSYQELGSDQTKLFGGSTDKKGNLKIKLEHGNQMLVPKKDIELFIREGHFALENDERVATKGETKTYQYQLPESIRKNADLIDRKLSSIKICDPAIGSGAFPVGLLHELVNAMLVLKPHLSYDYLTEKLKGFGFTHRESISDSRYIYRLKRHIIQESIYGVDIDSSAIDIARLRLWLSLVVDEDDLDPIETLPNLDYKIVCGNSLIGMPRDSFRDVNVEKELEELKDKFYDITDEKEKKALRQQINTKIRELLDSAEQFAGYKIDFDFKLFFSEVWREKGGFDVVIGNPPYVNVEKIDPKVKAISKSFRTAHLKYDLYVLFFEKAIDALKPKGTLSFITSNKFLSQGYGLKLREEFLKHTITEIINFNYDVFNTATVRTCILQLNKIQASNNHSIKIIDVHTKNDAVKFEKLMYEHINQVVFNSTESNNFRINLTDYKLKLISKIEKESLTVEEVFSVNYGLRPSSEKLDLKKDAFIFSERENPKLKDYFEGKDMGYWKIKNKYYLDYRPDVMYNPMFENLFVTEKLVGLRTLSDISKLRFIYDNQGFYCNDSVVVLTLWHLFKNETNQTIKRNITENRVVNSKHFKYRYAQAILNSSIIKFYFNELMYDGTHFYPNHMKVLPLKKASTEIQEICVLISHFNFFLELSNHKIQFDFFNQLIDTIVFELYFPEEIKTAGKEILKHLGDLKPITDDMSEEEKLAIIQSEFERLYDPNHPVRFAIETLDSVEEVRIIKEALK